MKISVKENSHLLEYLYSAFEGQSRTKTKSLLTKGCIAVNGTKVTAYDFTLKPGDIISVGAPAPKEQRLHGRLRIIYEDAWLIVADKAAGLPSISTGKGHFECTVHSILNEYMRSKGGRAFIVHRLDRDTSGLIVLAKDEHTKRLLQDNWENAVTERTYRGIAEGIFDMQSDTITSWLKEHPKSLKMTSSPTDNGGKKAVTSYQVISSREGLSELDIRIHTGRKNQIRVQLASIGHPLAGDKKYGAVSNPFGRLALHACGLSFSHPHTAETLSFSSKPTFSLTQAKK